MSTFNGYEAAGKVDKVVERILASNKFTKANQRDWMNFSRTVRTMVDQIDLAIEQHYGVRMKGE